MRGKKTPLIVVGLALFAGLAVLMSRPDERGGAGASDASRGPSFEVQVVRPRSGRPLFGILPRPIEAKLTGGDELAFDSESGGAEVGSVGHDRLELRADGWELVLETDGDGKVAPGTHLVFPILLADRQRTLRCRPADPAIGYLRTSERDGSGELDGRFRVKLATCTNAETGKTVNWPPRSLTVLGSFAGLIAEAGS